MKGEFLTPGVHDCDVAFLTPHRDGSVAQLATPRRCRLEAQHPHEAPCYSLSTLKLLVRNQTRNAVLGGAVDVADTSASRRTGLLGRDELKAGEGLWIVPCESVHTFFMKFPIDLVYLDRPSREDRSHRRVRKVRNAVPPWRLSACLPAHSVLELPAGTVARTGTAPGDELVLEELP